MLLSAACSSAEDIGFDEVLAEVVMLLLADPVLLLEREVGVGTSGTIDGTSAVAGVWALVDSEPDCRIDRPPGRIEPENAAFSDCWRTWYLEMLTDEIENSTMNSANSSVSMSA